MGTFEWEIFEAFSTSKDVLNFLESFPIRRWEGREHRSNFCIGSETMQLAKFAPLRGPSYVQSERSRTRKPAIIREDRRGN